MPGERAGDGVTSGTPERPGIESATTPEDTLTDGQLNHGDVQQFSAETSQEDVPGLDVLNDRQQTVYLALRDRFRTYLRTRGKVPRKAIGYAPESIGPRVSRVHRAFEWIWEHNGPTTEFTERHGDQVVEALDTDAFRRRNGQRYSETSKRKIVDALRNWFEFNNREWDPEVRFTDDDATNEADPFSRGELQALWQSALEYKSIPSYNNLSPTDRDRWKVYIAEQLGKPKSAVTPADWETINHDWKIPALVRTTRVAGWRPAMVSRLKVEWYEPTTKTIYIPSGEAVKNDASWEQELDHESALVLERWLNQRTNHEKYDGRQEIWLNRRGNPYDSGSLNNLLGNLIEAAGMEPHGRKLVWYSFRHSIGTYLYDEYRDLKLVAEMLRQKSLASADRYVHPTPELKREAAGGL